MRKMKDSGVEWIGKIPEEWRSNPLRQVIVSRDGGAWGDDPEEDNNAVICLRIADFDYEKAVFKNTPENELTYRKYTYIQKLRLTLKLGDILIEKSGGGEKTPVGRAVLFDKDCNALFANFMDRIRVNPAIVSASFVMYWLKALYSCQVTPYYIKQTTGIQNLDLTMLLAKERIMYPEINSQLSIVSYLDSKCSQIDALVSDIEKQITTLEQYKRSVITEAVTKGLDQAVPMKDSGIEWIGQIPEEWVVSPLKYNFIVYSGATPKTEISDYWDGDITWITPADYKTTDIYISTGNRFLTRRGLNSCGTTVVPVGSIIFSKRAPVGTVAINNIPLCTNQGCLSCVPIKGTNSKFYYYLMSILTEQYELVSSGTTFKEISSVSFSNYKLPNPPTLEQCCIADYLDTKCSEIDSAISLKKQQIKTLIDHKKSLIYEYVTGKKEIPA